jgi:hypothetical protein
MVGRLEPVAGDLEDATADRSPRAGIETPFVDLTVAVVVEAVLRIVIHRRIVEDGPVRVEQVRTAHALVGRVEDEYIPVGRLTDAPLGRVRGIIITIPFEKLSAGVVDRRDTLAGADTAVTVAVLVIEGARVNRLFDASAIGADETCLAICIVDALWIRQARRVVDAVHVVAVHVAVEITVDPVVAVVLHVAVELITVVLILDASAVQAPPAVDGIIHSFGLVGEAVPRVLAKLTKIVLRIAGSGAARDRVIEADVVHAGVGGAGVVVVAGLVREAAVSDVGEHADVVHAGVGGAGVVVVAGLVREAAVSDVGEHADVVHAGVGGAGVVVVAGLVREAAYALMGVRVACLAVGTVSIRGALTIHQRAVAVVVHAVQHLHRRGVDALGTDAVLRIGAIDLGLGLGAGLRVIEGVVVAIPTTLERGQGLLEAHGLHVLRLRIGALLGDGCIDVTRDEAVAVPVGLLDELQDVVLDDIGVLDTFLLVSAATGDDHARHDQRRRKDDQVHQVLLHFNSPSIALETNQATFKKLCSPFRLSI